MYHGGRVHDAPRGWSIDASDLATGSMKLHPQIFSGDSCLCRPGFCHCKAFQCSPLPARFDNVCLVPFASSSTIPSVALSRVDHLHPKALQPMPIVFCHVECRRQVLSRLLGVVKTSSSIGPLLKSGRHAPMHVQCGSGIPS